MRKRFGAGVAALVIVVCTSWVVPRLSADDPGPPPGLTAAARFLNTAAPAAGEADLKGRAKYAAWSLMVGELAADPQRAMLYSGSVDALGRGLAELDRVEAELKADPAKQTMISKDPLVAMQLDGARVRRDRSEASLKLSREEERGRLVQLRELVRAYRDVANSLAVSNAHLLMGDMESTRAAGEAAARKLAELEAVAGRRRDYYLFTDEPDLNVAGTSELRFVTSAPQPFSDEMKPHVTAVQALAVYRLAVGGPAPPDVKVLEAAQTLAEGALGTGEAKNVIALYVMGNVRRQLGLLLTARDPLSARAHEAAAPHFQAARECFKTLQARTADRPDPLSGVRSEVEQHARELAAADVFLADAERLTLRGRLAEAQGRLDQGLRYHRSGALLLARSETARRGAIDVDAALGALEHAKAERLIRPDDSLARLVGAKLVLARAWGIVTSSLEKMGPRERSALGNEVAAQQQALEGVGAANARLGLQMKAYASLAAALRAMIDPSADAVRQEAELRQAAGIASTLAAEVRAARAGWDTIALREALVACRLAHGYLAVRVLPTYRDDAINAFAAAADEQARLPFQASALKVLGSPLVTAMLSRPEGQSVRLAQEERQLRQVVTRFLQGAFSQSLGSDSGAAAQMASALDEIRGAAENRPADSMPLDAGQMLDRGETTDARKTTLRQIRSFSVLSFVKAGEARRGLIEAVRTVVGDDLPAASEEAAFAAITPALLDRATRSASSPLEAFSLGHALEAHALSPQPGPTPAQWLAAALQAHLRAKGLFDDSKAARDRFPQLVAMNDQAVRRLSSPQDDLDEARRLRRANQFGAAVARLRATSIRHPHAPAVAKALALCIRDQVDLGQADESALQDALRSLQSCRAAADAGVELVIAEIEERLGRTDRAIASYRAALARTPTPEERIQAGARLAVLASQGSE